MSRNDRMIAKAIISAQYCSDAGKGRMIAFGEHDEPHSMRGPKHMKYDCKVNFILRAIKLIDGSKSIFRYYVTEEPDQNGYPSILVYFFTTKKSCGEKLQVSFHSPAMLAGELKKYIGKGTVCRWDKRIGGSQEDCDKLAIRFNL